MRRLIASGVSPSDAAQTALEHKGRANLRATDIKYVDRSDLVNAIHRSALALDREVIVSSLTKDIKKNGVISTWQEVIVPVLSRVGDEWERTGVGIEVEHLLTEILKD
jgi:hypothetical protein